MQTRRTRKTKRRRQQASSIRGRGIAFRVLHVPFENGPELFRPAPDTGTRPDDRTYPIKLRTEPVAGLYVGMMQDGEQALFSSVKQMHQAIADLHPIVSAMPGFKDKRSWRPGTAVWQVLGRTIDAMAERCTKEQAAMRIVKKDGLYAFNVQLPCWFSGSNDRPLVPVYYLPLLDQVDQELHDLLKYLIAILSKQCDFTTWSEDIEGNGYYYDEMKEEAKYIMKHGDEDEDEKAAYRRAIEQYGRNGVAYRYAKEIERRGASIARWLDAYDAYKPRTAFGREFYKWLGWGKIILINKRSIHTICQLPPDMSNEDDIQPMTPEAYMRFVWGVNDAIQANIFNWLESHDQEAGSVPPFNVLTLSSAQQVKSGLKPDVFTEAAIKFFCTGAWFEVKHRKKFNNITLLKQALYGKGNR